MMTKKRIWVLFVMTLLAGMMAGAAVMQVYIQTRLKVFMRGENERYYEYFLRRLNAELKLNPEQAAQAKAVILANQEQITRIRQRSQPEIEQLAAQANAKILQNLTPKQAALFKDFIVRFPQPGIRSLGATPVGVPPKAAVTP
ncbi:MAG: hypothetical protein NTY53_17455 [Kiritimatiellaeota bacterium]|nr:hypothetical protein [Kiritimatiellota bacterium]